MKDLVNRLRLTLILATALAVVMVDSVSRVISIFADLGLVVVLLALCWGPLAASRKPKE